jgi:hypothetical protein
MEWCGHERDFGQNSDRTLSTKVSDRYDSMGPWAKLFLWTLSWVVSLASVMQCTSVLSRFRPGGMMSVDLANRGQVSKGNNTSVGCQLETRFHGRRTP